MKTYMCSGSKFNEPITKEQCLECALKREQDCGYDYALLKSMLSDNTDRSGVHVTDTTGCLLRSYWDKTRPQPSYIHEMLPLYLGVAIHKYLEVSDENMEAELPIEQLGLKGTADVVYKDGVITDYKTVRWMKMKYLPKAEHIWQVNIYRRMLKEQGKPVDRLFIQYIDLSGPTKCIRDKVAFRLIGNELRCPICGYIHENGHLGAALIEVPIFEDWQIDEHINERGAILRNAIENKSEPYPEPGFLCRYCHHTDICPR